MQTPKSTSLEVFIAVLKYYGMYQPLDVYKIVCPFHGDVNASLQVNINKRFFYCYGCGAHGTTYDLVKLFNPNYDLIKVNNLINKISSSVSIKANDTTTSPYNPPSSPPTSLTYSEGLKIARDFYDNLPITNWYKTNEDTFPVKHYFIKRKFKTKTLVDSEAKATYNEKYPIVFPIYDNGLFRGYVMRTPDPTVEAERKYMYNRGFKRDRTLAGDYRTKTLILVEGFLDKLKANQLGIHNVVAILGWKLTGTQLKKIKRAGIKTIICGLDNDEKGKQGYRYLKLIADKNGLKIKRIRYPKKIKDFGDLNEDNAQDILNQIKRLGGS